MGVSRRVSSSPYAERACHPGTAPPCRENAESLDFRRLLAALKHACNPRQMPSNGTSARDRSRTASRSRSSIQRRIIWPKCPTPGSRILSASPTASGSL